MSSLSDFAITAGLQQEQNLREAQHRVKEAPRGINFALGHQFFVKLIVIAALAPCLIPIWLFLMPFRLAGKVNSFKTRFKGESTSKKQ